MMQFHKILLIEDNTGDIRLVRESLTGASYYVFQLQVAMTLKEGMSCLQDQEFDTILLDLNLPDSQGVDTLMKVIDSGTKSLIIVLTGIDNIELGLELMRSGAHAYLSKSRFDAELFLRTIIFSQEQKRIQEARRASEERFRTLFDHMNEGFALCEIILDDSGKPCNYRFIEVNRAYEIQTGRKTTDLIGKNVRDVIPDLEPFWIETFGKVALNGVPIHFENYDNRSKRYYSISSFSPEKGQFTILVTNITERKLTEQELIKHHEQLEALVKERTLELEKKNSILSLEIQRRIGVEGQLRDSQSRLQLQFDRMPLGCIIWGTDQRVLSWNPAAEMIFGYTAEEMVGTTACDILVSDEIKPKIDILWDRLLTGDLEANSINENKTRDGHQIICEWTNTTMYDRNGKTSGVISMVHEITERIKSEHQLKIISQALEQSPALVAMTDIKGNIEYVNSKFREVTGYTEEEAIGKNPRLLKSGKHSPEFYKTLWDTILAGNEWHGIFQNKKKNGEFYWASVSISPVRDPKGQITHFLALQEDISEKIRLDEELIKAKEAAEASNYAKSEFLANMSHEIRTPMNVIIGSSELLASMVTNDKKKAQVNSILSSARSLLRIIEDILDLSRIEAGRLNLQREPVDINNLILDVEKIFSQKLKEKNIDFLVEPKSKFPRALMLDEVRIRQILFNLVGNAVKFTDKGYVKLSLVKTPHPENDNIIDLTITVKDTGIGIAEKDQQMIFESFSQQTGQDARKYGGTGLGLAITKRLVEMMGGKISVVSKPGKGSKFRIDLPDVEMVETSGKVKEIKEFKPDFITFKPAKILIVDDHRENRKLYLDLFENSALTLFEAENGKEAIEKASKFLPDLILMDLLMPVMSGIEATKILKSLDSTKSIPVIAVTASTTSTAEIAHLQNLFDEILLKPVSIIELIDTLKKYLKHISLETRDQNIASADGKPVMTKELVAVLPEIIQSLEREFIPKYNEILTNQMIDEIENFVGGLVTLGEKHSLEIISRYGNELKSYVDNFEIDKISGSLEKFPDIINKIKSLNPVKE